MESFFPSNFIWGAASSSYQIEGAHHADGKGPSVWDAYCRREGAIRGGHSGDVACDHYHQFPEDIGIMRQMGLQAYRFSISWPRVLPLGVGNPNEAGLAFYDALVDKLLDAGIQPWVTLFHWDYPQALQSRGGWLNPQSPQWFEDFTRVIVKRLSDRVTHWITINEPQIFLGLGHGDGTHAPGLRLSFADRLLATHHALLSHGRSVQVIRAHAKRPPIIGWAPCGRVEYPAVETPSNIEAARHSTFSIFKHDSWNNTWFADPVCLGRYPEDGLRLFHSDLPRFANDDLATICQPLDFYGVNIYSGDPVIATDAGAATKVPFPPGHPQTAFRWNIAPASLRWGPRFLYERYNLPIVVTENGMSNIEIVEHTPPMRVRDPQRIEFTRQYLLALSQAWRDGTDIRGYFHWSVMDNFEWAEGYTQRFGLVYVDFPTGKRIPKDSAQWYREVIASNGGCLLVPAPVDVSVPVRGNVSKHASV